MKTACKELKAIFKWLLCVILFVFLFNSFVAQRTIVDGISMEPTLRDGDNLIVEKISRLIPDYKRYDIILINTGSGILIKRIIALPGEKIYIGPDGNTFIDGVLLDDPYGDADIQAKYRGIASEEITLTDNEYFVMGDNRQYSIDSRDKRIGVIESSSIIGRVFFQISPVEKFGFI